MKNWLLEQVEYWLRRIEPDTLKIVATLTQSLDRAEREYLRAEIQSQTRIKTLEAQLQVARQPAESASPAALVPTVSIDAAVASDIMGATSVLVVDAEITYKGMSGEAKRHQVYSRLLKLFPSTPKATLGLAIELAVRDR